MDSLITNPTLSVVFTSYNHEEYLQQAIESILGQTFRDFELIIVDDCSTDGSRLILESYRDIREISLYLLESNTGSYVKASHYGALKAKGKYLLFAQCDDYSEPNQFSRLMEAIRNHQDAGVVFSRSKLVNETGSLISDDFSIRQQSFRKKCKSDTMITGLEMRAFLSYACVIPNLSAALMRRDLYFEVGGLPEKYIMAADWAFWLSMAEKTNFYYIAECLNNFRQHGTTIRSSVKVEKQLIEIYSLFKDHVYTYKFSNTEKDKMMNGFGNIWFSYLLESPKSVISCFRGFYKKISEKNMSNMAYLVNGSINKIGAIIRNKFQ
jgi:glycosyltransferase involved in cell wall biosynthesis